MALRAIADDGDLLALDEGEVGVLVVENFHGGSLSPDALNGCATLLQMNG
jgi:hypothetical protein